MCQINQYILIYTCYNPYTNIRNELCPYGIIMSSYWENRRKEEEEEEKLK
jgi:hypothetical protein